MMQRVLLIGCGDVALRVAQRLRHRARLIGLTRNRDDVRKLRANGIVPLVGDLDDRRTLERLRTAPFAVLHLAPPPSDGRDDPRTRHLLAALASARIIPRHLVYISTSGVYGDCAGARVAETRPRRPHTPRARRRVAAEDRLRAFAVRNGVVLSILRAPGIYASTRLPLERLKHGTPALAPDDDVFTNHVHGPKGVRINAINPGGTLTGRVQQGLDAEARMTGLAGDEILRQQQARIPLQRLGTPEEIAQVALFLASAQASYVTGAIIPMDGGAAAVI